MKIVRSLVFDFFFYATSIFICLFFWPLLALPLKKRFIITKCWSKMVTFWAKHILGLNFTVKGMENLPPAPFVVACKHQSAWETVALCQIIPCAVFILKKELLYIPILNWYFRGLQAIAVKRGGGMSTIEEMVHQSKKVIDKGLSIIIFPEGTRSAVGKKLPYKRGISILYRHLNVPIVPIALNSGIFWGRRSFLKKSGTIEVEILPPLMPGIDRDDFLNQLEDSIETASQKLCSNALADNKEDNKNVKKAS